MGRKHPAPRRVFLSHTSDLLSLPKERSYVAAAEAAIVRAGNAVSRMSYFGARAESPRDVCRAAVREAQVYVIIAGFRYGSPVLGNPEMSYCELEHQFAAECRIPRLVFLIDTDADGSAEMMTDGAPDDRQLRFRTRLSDSGVTVSTVSDPADLEYQLLDALARVGNPGRLALAAIKARQASHPWKARIVAGLVAILGVAGLTAWIGSSYGNIPNDPEHRAIHAALIAKIGPDGRAFLVGRRLILDPTDGGELHFRINDAVMTDNDGELSLTLTRQ